MLKGGGVVDGKNRGISREEIWKMDSYRICLFSSDRGRKSSSALESGL